MSRTIEGRIRNCTISKDGKEWYVSFNCKIELSIVENHGPAIGIDRGVVHTLTTSDEKYIDLPTEEIKKSEERKAQLQRRKRKQIKYSANWTKTQRKLRDIDKKIRRIRHDWIHKATTDLAKNHGLIIMEDLQIKNMTKSASGTIEEPGKNVVQKSGLNRSILRQGWGMFETVLKYKCERLGVKLLLVSPHYTSKECSSCGEQIQTMRPNQATFRCLACGTVMNADYNATLNILTRGQRGSACGGDRVARPVEAGTTLDGTTRKRKSLKESPTIVALAI